MPKRDHHLEAAWGYLDLGMPEDAETELRQLEHSRVGERDVQYMWLRLWMTTAKWDKAVIAARALATQEPDDAGWRIQLAYSMRRAESILEAEVILREALEKFPRESLIVYNLACYAAQTDRLEEARHLLRKAFEMNATHYREAQTDPDLAPLHAELSVLLSSDAV